MDRIYRQMEEADIPGVIPLYIAYYNQHDGGCWTYDTTYKRIHQVWSREDSLCLLLEQADAVIGFAMGYFEQYDDIAAFDLVEIVIATEFQNQGIGTAFMMEIERRAKAGGAAMIQIQAVNDKMHAHFYGKLQYHDATNLVLKSKWLDDENG